VELAIVEKIFYKVLPPFLFISDFFSIFAHHIENHSIFCGYYYRSENINQQKMEILDETDLQILRTLQKNSKLTTKELADKVHLTPTPVFERQKRLERRGYIKKYVAVLDADKLGLGLQVFCKVKLKQINHEIADAFTRRILRIPEVTECYNTSGAYDYLLKVRAKDMKQYQDFVLNKLGDIESLSSIESTFVMSEVKQDYAISI
jgi:Lrp/AsnC family leucine-responsive transcriptional regulator